MKNIFNMENLKELLRKRLSEQYRGKNMIWSLAVNEIKSYLNIPKIDPEVEDDILTWYVRYDKLFIKTAIQDLKIQIFKKKFEIIERINKKLDKIGYTTKIKDIILK